MMKKSSMLRRLMVLMMVLAVVVSYSVLPMNQTFAASAKKPAKVKSLKVTAMNDPETSIRVSWKKAKNAKKYQVYRATKKKGKYKKVATVKKTTYVNKGLKDGKKYFYKVRAVNGKKKGKYSAVKSATAKYVAAAAAPAPTPVPAVSEQTVYVTPEWLNSALKGEQAGYENVVVLEVSYADPGNKTYANGHVPGAIKAYSIEVEDATGDPGEYKAYNLLSVEEIRSNLLAKGVTADTKVVLYDAGGDPCEVGRQAYAYIVAGVKDVKILDGHLAAWTKAGFATETNENTGKAASSFGDAPAHLEYWTSITDAKDKLDKAGEKYDPDFKLVSIRSEAEWLGVTSGYSYMDKAGEPEGAVWGKGAKTAFDVADFVNDDGTVKTLDGFKEVWKDCNFKVDDTNHLAFYCGTGWRATVPFLVLYQNGFKNISVYDGGWYEWLFNDSYPVQVGDPDSGECQHTTVGELPTGKAAQ